MSINNKRFFYNSNNDWVPVHEWFNFFIKTGFYFSTQSEQNRKSVMSISVPATHFLPSLLALGVIAGIIESVPHDSLLHNHFSALVQLKVGTLVRFRDGGRQKIAKFMGVKVINDETRLIIQSQNPRAGGLVDYVPKKRAFDISVSNNQHLQIPNNQVGRVEEKGSAFLDSLFNNVDKQVFRFSDPKVCLIGNKDTLEVETKETPFAVISGDAFNIGYLNEILKIRQFQGATDTYQSEVFASQSKNSDVILQPWTVIIYCSAVSYLNWSHKFPDNNSIILLDRSETQYPLAIDEINNRYLENMHCLETVRPNLSEIPQGIEILNWKEDRR